jgi:hypothetical protein
MHAIRRTLFVGVLILAILACNLPAAAPTTDPAAAWTAAAMTVAAAMNQPPTVSALPPATPIPTRVPTDTFTPLPSLSPTSFFTSTPTVPVISVSVDTNCRSGPGKIYERVGGLLVGETAEVIARDPSGEYWYIQNPDKPNGFCWVWGEYASLSGNIVFLPVYTPPPTPTPEPDFEVVDVNVDSCVGWWLEFSIENIGAVTFESVSVVIKDMDTGTTLSDMSNSFTDLGGCVSSSIVKRINPGEMRVFSGPAFIYDPSGHKITTSIKLCTADTLEGTCITKQINFRP